MRSHQPPQLTSRPAHAFPPPAGAAAQAAAIAHARGPQPPRHRDGGGALSRRSVCPCSAAGVCTPRPSRSCRSRGRSRRGRPRRYRRSVARSCRVPCGKRKREWSSANLHTTHDGPRARARKMKKPLRAQPAHAAEARTRCAKPEPAVVKVGQETHRNPGKCGVWGDERGLNGH